MHRYADGGLNISGDQILRDRPINFNGALVFSWPVGGHQGCVQQDLCHLVHQLSKRVSHLDPGPVLTSLSQHHLLICTLPWE